MSSLSVAFSSMADKAGKVGFTGQLGQGSERGPRVAGSGSEARAKTRSISCFAPFSPTTSMRPPCPGGASCRGAGRLRARPAGHHSREGPFSRPRSPLRHRRRRARRGRAGRPRLRAGRRPGWRPGERPDHGCFRLSRTKGRAEASPRRPSIPMISARTSGSEAAALAIHWTVASPVPRDEASSRAAPRTAPTGLSTAPISIGDGFVPEDRYDEGKRLRGHLALFGAGVGTEDRPGRRQPFTRLSSLREPAGEKKIKPGGLGPFTERGIYPDLREDGRRGRVADIGQGETGRPAKAFVAASSQGEELLHGRAAAHLAESVDGGQPGRRRSRASRALRRAWIASGPPIVLSAATAGSGQRFVGEISRQGRTASVLPRELDLGDEERGHLLVLGAVQCGEQGPDEQEPLSFGPGSGHVNGEPVQGEPDLGVVSRPGWKDTGAGLGDGSGSKLEDLGAKGVFGGGGLGRKALQDRGDAALSGPAAFRGSGRPRGQGHGREDREGRGGDQRSFHHRSPHVSRTGARAPAWAGRRGGWPRRRPEKPPAADRSGGDDRAERRSWPD